MEVNFPSPQCPVKGLGLQSESSVVRMQVRGENQPSSSTYPDSCNSAIHWTLLGGSDNGSNVCSDWGFNKLESLMQALFHSLLGENAHTSDSKVFCQLAM